MDFMFPYEKEKCATNFFGTKNKYYTGIVDGEIGLFNVPNSDFNNINNIKRFLANNIYPIIQVYEYNEKLKTLNNVNIQKIQIFYKNKQEHKDVYIYKNGLIFKIKDYNEEDYFVNDIINSGKIFNLEYQIVKGFNNKTLEEDIYVLYNKGNDLYYGMLEYNKKQAMNVGRKVNFLGIELYEIFFKNKNNDGTNKKGFVSVRQKIFNPNDNIEILDIYEDDTKMIGKKDKDKYQKILFLDKQDLKEKKGYMNKYGNIL